MTSRWELHHSVHARFGDTLCYYFLNFNPPYEFGNVRKVVKAFFTAEGIQSFASFEIFGAIDVIIRAWIPSVKVADFEQKLGAFLQARRCYVDQYEVFHVSSNPAHFLWPDGIPATNNEKNVEILNTLNVSDINDPEKRQFLIDSGLLKELPEVSDGIRVFIAIPIARGIAINLADGLPSDIFECIKRAQLGDAVVYRGIGNNISILVEAVVKLNDYYHINDFNNRINELGWHRAGLKTTTYLTARRHRQFATTTIATSEQFEVRNERTIDDLLLADESATLEHKGSFELDIGRFLATDQKSSNPNLQKEVLSTIVAFLNSEGGELLIGAIEAAKFKGSILQKLNQLYPPHGEMRLIGIEWEYDLARDKNWDGYQRRMIDIIIKRIGGSYTDYIKIQKLTKPIADTTHDFCLIKAFPLPAGETAFLDDADCYVRSGATSRLIQGRDLELRLSRRGKSV